ncbi:MAG TPA: SRPBCC family protein [Chthoniobacterales bacterium]|jgi:uncharacterized membrane protein|nr:SRPBCC family protein [Chthoniobacterales bacterium]
MEKLLSSKNDTRKGGERLAKALGWFSVGLGVAEIAFPRALERFIGVRRQPVLLPALGFRELISGIGILATKRPAGWIWSRVAGDAMDLSLLAGADICRENDKARRKTAFANVLGVTALDIIAAVSLTRSSSKGTEEVVQTITIGRSPKELYQFWRTLENLPRVMPELEQVRETELRRSHWVARWPGGRTAEWDAEITSDRPNESISWRTLPNSRVAHTGRVHFTPAPGDRGTIVRVELTYHAPTGSPGRRLLQLFGQAPEQKIQTDLYRLKQIIETGTVTTTEGQPAGRGSSISKLYDWGTVRG